MASFRTDDPFLCCERAVRCPSGLRSGRQCPATGAHSCSARLLHGPSASWSHDNSGAEFVRHSASAALAAGGEVPTGLRHHPPDRQPGRRGQSRVRRDLEQGTRPLPYDGQEAPRQIAGPCWSTVFLLRMRWVLLPDASRSSSRFASVVASSCSCQPKHEHGHCRKSAIEASRPSRGVCFLGSLLHLSEPALGLHQVQAKSGDTESSRGSLARSRMQENMPGAPPVLCLWCGAGSRPASG